MKVIISSFLIMLLVVISSGQERADERINSLVLRAEVLEARFEKLDDKQTRCHLKLNVSLVNTGKEPFVILHDLDREYRWLSGVSIVVIAPTFNFNIHNNMVLPSVCGDCYRDIKRELDQEYPPEKFAKVLHPNETWTFDDEQAFSLPIESDRYGFGWTEIADSGWLLHGRLSYSLLPNNIGERFREKLRKKWSKVGLLYYHGTHSIISSEPFEVDLRAVKF